MSLSSVALQTFQLRAHIFQGRFDPGMDASGLLDPIVRVTFHGYTASTRVSKFRVDNSRTLPEVTHELVALLLPRRFPRFHSSKVPRYL